ncbi:MAG: flagellar basal body P-ring protein FlgI [Phycisphaerales bacterium]
MIRPAPFILAAVALCAAVFAQPGAGGSSGLGAAVPNSRPKRENPAISIQDLVRIDGQASSWLRGVGIVTGLPKTGDSAAELVVARPLAKIYENNGLLLDDLSNLAKGKSAAIVTLSAEIPQEGGRKGDRFDVFVQVSHSASSLKGGTLVISPMLHPLPNHPDPVYGFAAGPITIEETDVPTVGRIRRGLQLIKDIKRRTPITDSFDLIVEPHFRSPTTTRMIASEINGITADLENNDDTATQIATAVDDTVVHVTIPEHERINPTNFIASVLTKRFSPSLMDLPAQVVVNERKGTIIVTGDVEISAVTIGSDRLVITTITPPPVPSAQDPLVSSTSWAEFGSTTTNAEHARIQDLLEAFKQLNIPVREQIDILAQIHQTGRLHAKFVRD